MGTWAVSDQGSLLMSFKLFSGADHFRGGGGVGEEEGLPDIVHSTRSTAET
jgi:hypothetical protein